MYTKKKITAFAGLVRIVGRVVLYTTAILAYQVNNQYIELKPNSLIFY